MKVIGPLTLAASALFMVLGVVAPYLAAACVPVYLGVVCVGQVKVARYRRKGAA